MITQVWLVWSRRIQEHWFSCFNWTSPSTGCLRLAPTEFEIARQESHNAIPDSMMRRHAVVISAAVMHVLKLIRIAESLRQGSSPMASRTKDPRIADPQADPELTRTPAASKRSRISLLLKPGTEKLMVVDTEFSSGPL